MKNYPALKTSHCFSLFAKIKQRLNHHNCLCSRPLLFSAVDIALCPSRPVEAASYGRLFLKVERSLISSVPLTSQTGGALKFIPAFNQANVHGHAQQLNSFVYNICTREQGIFHKCLPLPFKFTIVLPAFDAVKVLKSPMFRVLFHGIIPIFLWFVTSIVVLRD